MEFVDERKYTYEYCTICNCLYSLNGRKQHFKTRKHKAQLFKLELTNEDIEIEHYILKPDGVVEVDDN